MGADIQYIGYLGVNYSEYFTGVKYSKFFTSYSL